MSDPGQSAEAGAGPEPMRLLLDFLAALFGAEARGASGWTRFAEAFAEAHAARAGGAGGSPFDPAGWLRAAGDGGMADLWRWLEGPGFADLFVEERAAIRASREWIAFAAAWQQYARVMGEGWLRAMRRFTERLAAEPGVEGPAATALWQEIADAEIAATQASPAGVAAQADLIAAGQGLREILRARVERVAAALGLPTRAELDDVHRQLHAISRELRALRRGTGPGA